MNYDNKIVVHCTLNRKHVTIISNADNAQPVLTGKLHWKTKEPIEHPRILHIYNKYMGGVDCNDQLMKYSAFSHRTCKWWKKVLFRLLNLAMVNAYITYSEWVALKGKKKLSQTSFQTEVIKQMIKSAALDLSRPTPGSPSTSGLEPQHLTGSHFPRKIEQNTKNQISHSCKVCVPFKRSMEIANGQKCKRPGHEISYECAQCEVSLRVVPCFSMYHTQQHYEDGYKAWK